jgi:iron complex transport system substrate-binding protein
MKTLLFAITYLLLFASTFVHADSYKRVAIAGGSITEIVYHLGEEQRIVGTDSTSQFPDAATNHPTIGYVRNVSVEGVLSLEPDLLIGELDTGPPKMLRQIAATGVNTVIIEKDDSLLAIKEKILRVALLLGVEQKASSLLQKSRLT